MARTRSKWDFGRKVGLLLADRRTAGLSPSTPAALAREVSNVVPCDSGTVYGWIDDGARPRSDRARVVAAILGVDFGWLTDDSQGYPPKENAANLSTALALLPVNERRVLEEILRDATERRAWIASWSARRGRP